MPSQNDKGEQVRLFFREIAEVMDRHGNISQNFVLAEAESFDMEPDPERREFLMTEAAPEELLAVMEAPRRKVCIRFGIDPRTGRRVCLQWVDAR